MRLKDDVAIVTGSTKGLGRFIAERYAAEGAKVVITGRRSDAGNKVAARIAEKGGEVLFVQADVMVEADVERLIKTTIEHFGKLTILVNNACPTELVYDASLEERSDGSARDISTEGWNSIIRGTMTQVFWCCKYAVRAMQDAGGGSIINISSMAGLRAIAGCVGYSAGKAGLFGLTRSVAVEEAPHGTRCNCIIVGMFPPALDEHGRPVDGGPPKAASQTGEVGVYGKAVRDAPLLGMGKGEDMASFCVFLGSRESKYLTGLTVPIDGGWSIKSFLPSVDVAFAEARAKMG